MARLTTDARRRQLLELGLGLFGTQPYDAVAIDDIAAEAGASRGLLYHYFGSKRSFYVACVRFAAERLLDLLGAIDLSDPERAVADGLDRYLGFVEGRGRAYRHLFVGGPVDPELLGILEEARSRIVGLILDRIGAPSRPIFRNAVRSWVGGVEASCIDWLRHEDLSRHELVQMQVEALRSAVKLASALDPEAPLRDDVRRVACR